MASAVESAFSPPAAPATGAARDPGSVPALAARDVTRRFGRHAAVVDLTLTAAVGETIGMLGPNGAGKTTTLAMLAGVLAPSAGDISVAGYDLATSGRHARRCIGFLSDPPPLSDGDTVRAFLVDCARLRLLGRRAASAADRVIERLGLTAYRERRIGTLSHGFRQRVGLAQALVHEPLLVILDEPTSGLDPLQTERFLALVEALKKECAIVLSSHHLSDVAQVCDRVFVLAEGRVVAQRTVRDPGVVVAGFAAAPGLDALRGLHHADAVVPAPGGRFAFHTSAPEKLTAALLETVVERGWDMTYLAQHGPLSAEGLNAVLRGAASGS